MNLDPPPGPWSKGFVFELRRTFFIESARSLPQLPEGHPCRRLHGHSFQILLVLRGDLDPKIGWVYDFHEIDTVASPILKELDHRVLNEVPGLENPTSEKLCVYLYEKLRPSLPLLHQVIIRETRDTECRYPVRAGDV